MKEVAADIAGVDDCSGAFLGEEPPEGEGGAPVESFAAAGSELETKSVSARAGGKDGRYFDVRRRFCEGYDEFIREIVLFTTERNWGDYSAQLRVLKDMFADLGNGRLSAWAHRLAAASGKYNDEVCEKETEPFCYAMYLFREKLIEEAGLGPESGDAGRESL
jgi:hypothetical protein